MVFVVVSFENDLKKVLVIDIEGCFNKIRGMVLILVSID